MAFARGFDVFGDGAQAETTAEFDDCFTQTRVEIVFIVVGDIAAIDLSVR